MKKPRNTRKFLLERRAAALISAVTHPHIVPLLFSFTHLQNYYLIFPWATSNLADYWENNKVFLQNESYMDYPRALWVAEQCEGLADALRYIHRFISTSRYDATRVVEFHHGDIKPENILVYCNPHQKPVLQLTGFGNSPHTTELDHTWPSTSAECGASDYVAPEVYFGEPASSSSDVWSLCCVFLEFIEWIMPSQSAPGQPRRVLTDCDENRAYVQGREAFRDWRRSRIEGGPANVAGYFFDTATGELSLWIDTVSRSLRLGVPISTVMT